MPGHQPTPLLLKGGCQRTQPRSPGWVSVPTDRVNVHTDAWESKKSLVRKRNFSKKRRMTEELLPHRIHLSSFHSTKQVTFSEKRKTKPHRVEGEAEGAKLIHRRDGDGVDHPPALRRYGRAIGAPIDDRCYQCEPHWKGWYCGYCHTLW